MKLVMKVAITTIDGSGSAKRTREKRREEKRDVLFCWFCFLVWRFIKALQKPSFIRFTKLSFLAAHNSVSSLNQASVFANTVWFLASLA
jgi:hypothetical protein